MNKEAMKSISITVICIFYIFFIIPSALGPGSSMTGLLELFLYGIVITPVLVFLLLSEKRIDYKIKSTLLFIFLGIETISIYMGQDFYMSQDYRVFLVTLPLLIPFITSVLLLSFQKNIK